MLTKIEMQAMDAIIGIRKELSRANEVNWERRRYEIARSVLASPVLEQVADAFLCGMPYGGEEDKPQHCAKVAVTLADALIAELKKESKQ